MTCLVQDLVDGLVQFEGAQHGLIQARIGAAGLGVALAEGGAVALYPSVCRAPEPAACGWPISCARAA